MWRSFSDHLPFSSFSCFSGFPFLPVANLPYPVAPVLPPVFSFSFSLFFIFSSYRLLPFSCRFFCFSCLSSRSSCCLLPSDRPPVPLATLSSHSLYSLLASVVSFFLAYCLFLSLFFHLFLFVVYRLFLPFSCRLFLFFLLTITFWETPAIVTCAFLSVVSFAAPALSLSPPPPFLFCFFSCSSFPLLVVYDFYF